MSKKKYVICEHCGQPVEVIGGVIKYHRSQRLATYGLLISCLGSGEKVSK